ncbi:hypothetical protein CH289_01105 [Rhodococcus sp. RS1C4]|nr:MULTISPECIES: hypothetical protein [unclassified Rhodococcus (in: high G+C Gram-positive bacteria)]OZC58774.1 hypothetical protein CH289_01105 [Rhodococcus sp. RS1C4]OZF09397.1 hypothetical protein CH300_01680 [Rhodococcus sp. 15-1154-1]
MVAHTSGSARTSAVHHSAVQYPASKYKGRDIRGIRPRLTPVNSLLGSSFGPRSSVTTDGTMELVVATPAAAPELWDRYVDGAWSSYSRHGVTRALDIDEVASGATTTLFYVVLDSSGEMLGGVRAQGPYTLVEQSHVLVEWENSPGLDVVTGQLRARLPYGIVEMKSAWVGKGSPGREVSALLARTALPTIELTGSRYLFASAADHVLRQWESSGGRIDVDVPAAAYPSDQYRTRLMWWDRETFSREAQPAVWEDMVRDAHALCGSSSSSAVA